MDRRTVLAGVAAGLAGLGGCLDAVGLGKSTFVLRASRANGDETDTTCDLPAELVSSHPNLESVLGSAAEKPVGEWARTGVDEGTGEEIGDALVEACGESGGLYRHDDEWFFISVLFRDGGDAADHHSGTHSH